MLKYICHIMWAKIRLVAAFWQFLYVVITYFLWSISSDGERILKELSHVLTKSAHSLSKSLVFSNTYFSISVNECYQYYLDISSVLQVTKDESHLPSDCKMVY